MTETLLDVRGLHAGYEGVAVVRGLTMHVNAGEVVALLGANGAGKTTTLRTISGLVDRYGGEVTVLGGPVPKLRRAYEVARRGMAHVPEGRGVLAQLTVRENLFLAKRRGEADADLLADRSRLDAAYLGGGDAE